MDKEYVIYQGVRMVAEWPARIVEAQTIRSYVIDGKSYARIRFGEEVMIGVQTKVLVTTAVSLKVSIMYRAFVTLKDVLHAKVR